MQHRRMVIALIYVFIAAALSAAAMSLLWANSAFLDTAYREEQRTVHRLAGALLSQYPELEPDFAAALDEPEERHIAAGSLLLSKYGYTGDRSALSDARYRDLYRRSMVQHTLFAGAAMLVAMATGLAVLGWCNRRNRQLTRAVESFLEGRTDALDLGDLRMHPGSYGRLAHLLGRMGDGITGSLARLDREKTGTQELVTDIAHQLKTPIAALGTCLDLVSEADDPTEQREFIDRSRREVVRLRDLGEALVSISRLEAAMIQPVPEPTPVSYLLAGAVSGVYPKAAAKSIEITTEPFEDVSVEADPRWTVEALTNLLDNAVKYSPEGTRIALSVKGMTHFVRIEVTDEGPGIPKSEAAQIFGRFYRGGHPAVRASEGSGVGLYLSRRIAEQQGGTVSHRPAPGGGTTFLLQLRAAL